MKYGLDIFSTCWVVHCSTVLLNYLSKHSIKELLICTLLHTRYVIVNYEEWASSYIYWQVHTYVLFCWLHLIIHNSIWMNFQFKSLHIDLSCTFMCPRCVAKLEVKPDLCFENLSWQLKIWKQNFGQGKRGHNFSCSKGKAKL